MYEYKEVGKFLTRLRKEKINTWFDLGIFIDSFREERPTHSATFDGSFEQFRNHLAKGGVGFITYHFSVDGVAIEIEKYADTLRGIIPGIPIHYIAGEFYPEANQLIDPSTICFEFKEIRGFDKWPLYKKFFFTKLTRGGTTYNQLIHDFWNETLFIAEKLGEYIVDHKINLLYLINVNSNPGNVSLSLALSLLSDGLGIPVINNNHDFFWEGGNNPIEKEKRNLPKSPRDFFYKNYDIGEFFSILEVLFPWESRSWINLNINKSQSIKLINEKGHNPANVSEINTAVDTRKYISVTKRSNIESFKSIGSMLSRYRDKLKVRVSSDVLSEKVLSKAEIQPVLIGHSRKKDFNFIGDNIVLLQPTRIIPRKRIETDFNLVKRLFDDEGFVNKFLSNPKLKLTLLISGPIPLGQYKYFLKLVGVFSGWLDTLDDRFKEKVFLAFLFSEFDKKRFKDATGTNVDMADIYNIASLVLLPSETEGRGLPIIEAAACGIPVFCRRYYPVNVYSEVIGEYLGESERFKVLEFDGFYITDKQIKDITDRIFFPQNFIHETSHNQLVVQKRFSLNSLQDNMERVLYQLYHQLNFDGKAVTEIASAIARYRKTLVSNPEELKAIVKDGNRAFLPGYGKLGFLLQLKSLIDPSYFRIEEQENKGMAMRFAKKLIAETPNDIPPDLETEMKFYNAVDNIFRYRESTIKTRHDHSFSYRHRNKYAYPYHEWTAQERSGLINMLFHEIVRPKGKRKPQANPHFFTDWNLALFQMTNSDLLEIDDRKRLIEYLRKNVPIAYFAGKYIQQELEYFILQPIRSRFHLPLTDELTENVLNEGQKKVEPVYIFCQEKALGMWYTFDELSDYLENDAEKELKLLYKKGIVRLVRTRQWTVGIHFAQLGSTALKLLREIKDKNGFLISYGDNPAVMTDFVDIDRFHIGKADKEMVAHIMGISLNSGFIQFAPAGIRTTLAYPTPIQTAKDFHDLLNSSLYKKLKKSVGEKKVLETLKNDAEQNNSPARTVLEKLSNKVKYKGKSEVEYSYVSGVYDDGLPWSGVIAKAKTSMKKGLNWKFAVETTIETSRKVTEFVQEFRNKKRISPQIAWNGGYILNAELVGKLGIPESYIGSPLGLIVSSGKVLSPPLFNKPALLITSDGQPGILRVNAAKGLIVSSGKTRLNFESGGYNPGKSKPTLTYYDLLFEGEYLNENDKYVVRLAGNIIKEIIPPGNKKIKIIPVGLTLAIPENQFPADWVEDKTLDIDLIDFPELESAIEAGPMLIENGRACIEMEKEGWKKGHSINTQAARIDFTDMRGPKIAVGLDADADLYVLTINGRIRESVGATHEDMANILMEKGIVSAMGFDPGGSSTLVVGNQILNISPYNPDFEQDVYALPPVPRGVSNAVIGWVEGK